MSAEGLITYLSENGQLIVFKYRPSAKKLLKNLVLDLIWHPDPTNLVIFFIWIVICQIQYYIKKL